jgi:Domain of unknown function (DUF5655)
MTAPTKARAPNGRRSTNSVPVAVPLMLTVEEHLRDKSDAVRSLFESFEKLIRDCGSYERSVTKTAIAYKGAVRGFAGVTPRRKTLTGFLDLAEQFHEAPFTRVTPYTKRLWVHRFVVDDLDQFDEAFAVRVAQAYAVGNGAHRWVSGTT